MNSTDFAQPIGVLHTPYKQKFGTPRQGSLVREVTAEIRLHRHLVPEGALSGLGEFSHIWLIFLFHLNNNQQISGKIKPPRLEGEKMGLFATRTPHRPNPIGLTLVSLISVDDSSRTLKVSGVDFVDQTPLLDIKPYIHQYDSCPDSRDGWLPKTNDKKYPISWSQKAIEDAESHSLSSQDMAMINASFCRDIRNQKDRIAKVPNQVYKVQWGSWDITLTYQSEAVYILEVTPWAENNY